MKTNNDNPRLKESLRQTYRSAAVSPYLAQRVIASIESNNQARIPWFKYAGGLLSMAVIILVVQSLDKADTFDAAGVPSALSMSLELPSIAIPVFPDTDIGVPGLASLSNVPGLNRFHTPARSLNNPRDICIFKQSGEMLC